MRGKIQRSSLLATLSLISIALLGTNSWALNGPVILGGDDLTDHGLRSGDVNEKGWLYIENALVHIDGRVARGGPFTFDVAALGSADAGCSPPAPANCFGGDAGRAIGSAANNAGLSVAFFDGEGAIATFFADLATGAVNPRIIWLAGTDAINDLEPDEGAVITANASAIAQFVDSGGGLMAHGFGQDVYGWLPELLPGLAAPIGCESDRAILTPAGHDVLPGISNANIDATAGPCHNHFVGDRGGLAILALDGSTAPASGVSVDESEPNDGAGTANAIDIGDDYAGEISPATDSDFLAFTANGEETILATVDLGTLLDSTLRLLDTDGATELAFDDDSGAAAGSRIEFTLPPLPGRYFLQVQSFAAACCTGTYTLELREAGASNRRAFILGGEELLPVIESIELAPSLDLNPVGTLHMVTASVQTDAGDPVPDTSVSFLVSSGPNAGEAGTQDTDAIGMADFAYRGNGGVGVDEITATFVDISGASQSDEAPSPIPATSTAAGSARAATRSRAADRASIRRGTASPMSATSGPST
jgi:hypothetical protein